jgi:hypothetical protein
MASIHVTALNRGGQVAHDLVVGALLPGSGSPTASWQGRILVLVFAVFGLPILFYLLTEKGFSPTFPFCCRFPRPMRE